MMELEMIRNRPDLNKTTAATAATQPPQSHHHHPPSPPIPPSPSPLLFSPLTCPRLFSLFSSMMGIRPDPHNAGTSDLEEVDG